MEPMQPKFSLYEYNVLNKDLLSSVIGLGVPSLQKLLPSVPAFTHSIRYFNDATRAHASHNVNRDTKPLHH